MIGALVYKTTRQFVQPGIEGIRPIIFDQVDYDDGGLWNQSSNRMVVPEGVRAVRLMAQAIFQWSNDVPNHNGVRQIVIKKNWRAGDPNWYAGRPGWGVGQVCTHNMTTVDVAAATPPLRVVPGDTFIVDAFVFDGVDKSKPIELLGINGTWFSMEVLERD